MSATAAIVTITAAAAVTGYTALKNSIRGEETEFPRSTKQTEAETLQSLKLDWVPSRRKPLQLRQSRAGAAKQIEEELQKSNKVQGAKDTERRDRKSVV